jgi:NAD(P)-dependent dehydrogenase (short-subunit alcohol dehydrogenase family)
MILKNKKILVAGAGGLLGAMLVKELIKQGSDVLALDIDVNRLKNRFDELGINTQGENVTLHPLDLSDKSAVSALFDMAEGLTGAVNCSYPRNKSYGKHFFDVDVDDFNENISLNLGSSFLFMQQCANYFKRTNTPFSLVNISSVYGVIAPKFGIYDNTPMTMPVEYAAIKSGLIHLSKYVTKYVGSSQFRVNLVSPGGILDQQPSDFLNAYQNETFGKGMLDVSDVLGAIVFLLSPMAEFVNGQNIVVDDGFSL